MSKTSPLFSIVIPTRNRAHLLRYAIQSALEQEFEDYEIVVSNNDSSDDTERVVQEFGNNRIRYFRMEKSLSMPDHWDFALSKSRGEWVTYLEDDNTISSRLLQQVTEATKEFPVKLVSWHTWSYYEPSAESSRCNQYVAYDVTGRRTYVESAAALANIFGTRLDITIPRMINSCCHRAVIHKVQKKIGRFFPPPAPDHTSCVASLAVVDRYVFIDLPLTLAGGGQTTPHSSPDSFSTFLTELDDESRGGYAPIAVPVIAPNTIVAESIFKVKNLMAEELSHIPVDMERYLEGFYIGMLQHLSRGFQFDEEKRLFREFLNRQPMDVRTKVRARVLLARIRHLLSTNLRSVVFDSPYLLNLAQSLSSRKIVHGEDAGFEDILGAVRHLDAFLFSKKVPSNEPTEFA